MLRGRALYCRGGTLLSTTSWGLNMQRRSLGGQRPLEREAFNRDWAHH